MSGLSRLVLRSVHSECEEEDENDDGDDSKTAEAGPTEFMLARAAESGMIGAQ